MNHDDHPSLSPAPQEKDGRDVVAPFEAKLALLRPRTDRLDCERIAFLAGQASVSLRITKRATLVGIPLESRAWPAAFAAMTVVAASLLFMLLTRPETAANRRSLNVAEVFSPSTQTSLELRTRPGILSPLDAGRLNLDTHLVDDSARATNDAPALQLDTPQEPVLTPSSWKQMIDESNAPRS